MCRFVLGSSRFPAGQGVQADAADASGYRRSRRAEGQNPRRHVAHRHGKGDTEEDTQPADDRRSISACGTIHDSIPSLVVKAAHTSATGALMIPSCRSTSPAFDGRSFYGLSRFAVSAAGFRSAPDNTVCT